jgi:hypothetical protein
VGGAPTLIVYYYNNAHISYLCRIYRGILQLKKRSQATEKFARAALKDRYAAYAGGMRSVYHESSATYLDVIYEGLDAETQTFPALINDCMNDCAFQEDMGPGL